VIIDTQILANEVLSNYEMMIKEKNWLHCERSVVTDILKDVAVPV